MKLLFDFMTQKWNLLQTNNTMFSVQLQRKTPHDLFQNPNIMRCKSTRILAPETGDKAQTWIKGLEKLSNNFILPDSATFHSNISMCPWQYLGEICISVYIYSGTSI